MKSLIYLLILKGKNNILALLKKPFQLLFIVVFVALMLFTVFSAKTSHSTAYRSIEELYSIVLIYFSGIFIMFSKNGFHSGASLFSMADVNLLFLSPIKSRTILTYGLFQGLGKAITLGFFILYQSSLIRGTYGVGFSALVFILIGYALTVLLSQMTAMIIYSFTCSDENKKRIVKGVYYFVIGGFFVLLVLLTYKKGNLSLVSFGETLRKKIFLFFPVGGVTSLFCEGMISGSTVKILTGLGLVAALIGLFYVLISLINHDYYEDVLKATEVSFSAITARKEGKAHEATPTNVKVGKTGLSKGFGASAISEKHKTENRRSRVFLVNITSLVFIALSTVYSFIMKDMPIVVFCLNVYMLTISVGTGRWAREFSYPYIYLIPESSFKKLFYLLKGDIPNLVAESILCFIPVHFILHQSIFITIGMIAARISFAFLFIGVNMILQRFFGSTDKKIFIGLAYFFLIILFSLPAILVGVFLWGILFFDSAIVYFVVAVVNTVVSAITLFLTRNVLSYSEINSK